MERLKGKNILITGASSGIGQAIAVRFAREGANIAINYRSGAEQAEATRVMARAARSNGARPRNGGSGGRIERRPGETDVRHDHRNVRAPRRAHQQCGNSEARARATKSKLPISTASSR